jgi:epoxide hydrolase 4
MREFSWTPSNDSGITQRFVEAGSLNFEIAECLPAGGNGSKLAICLHGFPELNYSWRGQMPMLAAKGWRVWAPNLRGYGSTDRPLERSDYALEHLVGDVAALIDAAQAEHPASEVMLVAHDWGAIIAWVFAIQKIRPLSHLIIMNVPHPKVAQREMKLWRQRRRSWYVGYFQIPFLPEFTLRLAGAKAVKQVFLKMAIDKSCFPPEVLDVYARAAMRPGALTAMLNYYRALVRDTSYTAAAGRALLDTPTLMIWGEEDTALNIGCTEGTEEWVRDFTLHRLPNVSHWVQQEAPERVNEAMGQWLGK